MRSGFGQGQAAEQHRGNDGDRIGLEQVRRHACTVADVVTDVVCNHGRIARVIFGDAGLDLAHQVGAHIGTLGENAATQARKDRNQR